MENNFKYIVYQTINIVNNKIYVGCHKTKDPYKFDGYIGNGIYVNSPSTYMNPTTPMQYAVKKYGTSSFKRSVLYIFDTAEEASAKETEIVNQDFVKREDTYNVIIGGYSEVHNHICRKVYQFNIDGSLVKEWQDVFDIEDMLGICSGSIRNTIYRKERLHNFYWSYNNSIDISEYSNQNIEKPVYKYSKHGKCIGIYKSLHMAAKENNMTPNHVLNCITNGALTKEDCYYSYTLYDEYVQKPRLDLKDKILYLYDLDGNYIRSCTTKEFKKEYNIHSYKELSNAILNNKPIQKNQLRLEKVDKIDKYVPKNKKKAVLVYTVTGEFVQEFESVTAACKILKLDPSTVSRILRGTAKTVKGYTIKYKNVE